MLPSSDLLATEQIFSETSPTLWQSMEWLAFKTVQNLPPLQADLNPPCQFGALWSRMIFEVMTFSFYFPCSCQCPWDQFVFHFKMTMHTLVNSVDMSLSKLQEMVKDRLQSMGLQSQTWLSDWTMMHFLEKSVLEATIWILSSEVKHFGGENLASEPPN